MARRSGVAVSAVHFYESQGLILATRNEGNQRRYAPAVLRTIAIIKVAQRTGIGLTEIKAVLSKYPPESQRTAQQWKAMSREWRDALDDRIRRLLRLRDELDSCIGCGCLSLTDCPLRNPGDALGAKGPGAHILERP